MLFSIESAKNFFSGLQETSPHNIMIPVVVLMLSGLMFLRDKISYG